MPRQWQSIDYVEPVHDTMMEQFGNHANYNVVDGCEPTYSAISMDVTVSAGHMIHNGTKVTVAGGSVTLVADGTNPRFSWVGLSSAGVVTLISGTAAANPAVPELGDYVEVCLVKIEAGQTSAAAITHKMDKRLATARQTGRSSASLSADTTEESTEETSIAGFSLPVVAATPYSLRALIAFKAPTNTFYSWAFTSPVGSTFNGSWETNSVNGILEVRDVHGVTLSPSGLVRINNAAKGTGASNPITLYVSAHLLTGANAGVVQFQHANYLASGGPVITMAKSRFELS